MRFIPLTLNLALRAGTSDALDVAVTIPPPPTGRWVQVRRGRGLGEAPRMTTTLATPAELRGMMGNALSRAEPARRAPGRVPTGTEAVAARARHAGRPFAPPGGRAEVRTYPGVVDLVLHPASGRPVAAEVEATTNPTHEQLSDMWRGLATRMSRAEDTARFAAIRDALAALSRRADRADDDAERAVLRDAVNVIREAGRLPWPDPSRAEVAQLARARADTWSTARYTAPTTGTYNIERVAGRPDQLRLAVSAPTGLEAATLVDVQPVPTRADMAATWAALMDDLAANTPEGAPITGRDDAARVLRNARRATGDTTPPQRRTTGARP